MRKACVKMRNKRWISTLFLILTMIVLGACGKSIDKDKQFVVGMEAGYAPFNWSQTSDDNGAVKIQGTNEYAAGYDVEVAKKIAESLGKELVIVKTEWDGLTPALVSGKLDAIIAGMSPTEERKQVIDFSDAYYESQYVLVVKKGGPFEQATSLKDFANAKVTAQLNTFHYSLIEQIPEVNQQPAMDNFSAMRVALQAGTIDAYVSELPEGQSAQAANEDFKMIELTDGFQADSGNKDIAVGLKKGSEYTVKVNEILSTITESQRAEWMQDAIEHQPIVQ